MNLQTWPGFEQPASFLILAIALPLLIYVSGPWAGKRDGSLLFASPLKHLEVKHGWAARWSFVPRMLEITGVVLLVAALARPRATAGEIVDDTNGTDLVLVLDTSTSMRAADMGTGSNLGGPYSALSRIDAAKRVMDKFVRARTSDRLALIVFAGIPMVACPLTFDRKALLEYLDYVYTGMLEDGTAVGDAVTLALAQLKDSPAKGKAIILLTDGRDNRSEVPPLFSAKMAKTLGVRIHTILIGSEKQGPVPFYTTAGPGPVARAKVPADAGLLEKMARLTGGLAGRAGDVNVLKSLFTRIDSMEKTRLPGKTIEHRELFQFFLVPGLGLLVIGFILEQTRFRRFP
ncbi:MAG: VWA domain-containing protein [Deltaproteobacteria bacterium]|nr:VWA domain-containing protein [Deltaproteobacteria bacterium]